MNLLLRRVLLIGLIVVLLLSGAVTAVAGIGPFDPGDGWLFRGQRNLEEIVVSLRSSPEGKVRQRIEIAGRRIQNVARLGGGEFETLALLELQQATWQAVQAGAACPQTFAGEIRLELLALVQGAEEILTQPGVLSTAALQGQDPFLRWMAAVTQLLRQPGLQLASLSVPAQGSADASPGGLPPVSVQLAEPTATPSLVDPQVVQFPPGSAGARHLFYPLVGQHMEIECTGCHIQGVYAGTASLCEDCHIAEAPQPHFPGKCELCHAPTGWVDIHYVHTSPGSADCSACHQVHRPAAHYPGQCSACHSTTAWNPAHFNHAAAQAGDCQACHAPDRPSGHWTGQCSACHSTAAWKPATFNHSAAGATNCQSCHDKNRPAGHWGGQCSACHATSAWLPATFNHAAASATDCASCHGGDKPANHWAGQCSACHSTSAWKPAEFNHAAVNATDCVACHEKNRPAGHWGGQCYACHSTSGWLPATFNHAAMNATDCTACHESRRPAGHWGGQCSACHTISGWTPATFNHAAVGATDCQSCHARPAGHWGGQCSACHSTNAWQPASFNHAAAGATDCQACHSRPANHYSGQCSACHSTSGWTPVNFNHTFPINHGGANGQCATCHPSGTGAWTCFNCHNQGELDKKHNEEGIPDYASRCMDCHADGDD